MNGTQSSDNISTRLDRIAELARKHPKTPLMTLAHHIDVDWLHEAFRRTRKDGAVGIDGQSGREYANDLGNRLQALLDTVKAGKYRAPAVRRVHIPKGNGETRPLGIPTFEDKVLQRAVAMVLEAVYEQEFYDCSYGFRPNRSARQAAEAFRNSSVVIAGGWVLELDIRKYFDTIDHGHLRAILSQRVRDGAILRLIGKWLNAGVMEQGALRRSESGTPQGGVISPILANIFLHEVLDVWFHQQVQSRLRGRSWMVRYADDAVMLFETEEDAQRVMEVLPKRFGRFGLTLHPVKTRLVAFKRPDRRPTPTQTKEDGTKLPESFSFLGFTFHWGKSLAGKWVVRLRTAKDRFRRTLQSIAAWCAEHRHTPLLVQQQAINNRLRGHYGYFGCIGNYGRLTTLRWRVVRIWKLALARRSQRGLTWARMYQLLKRFPLNGPPPMQPKPCQLKLFGDKSTRVSRQRRRLAVSTG